VSGGSLFGSQNLPWGVIFRLAKSLQPDQFRLDLNNTIQALRNVTFLLQKIKPHFPIFEEWYSTWQNIMRADHLMRWLVEARNVIVKEGDLETYSIARVSVVDSWFEPPKFEMLVPPFTKTEDFALILQKTAPQGILWDVGLLRVERVGSILDFQNKKSLRHLPTRSRFFPNCSLKHMRS
jgi:hypothetical protein